MTQDSTDGRRVFYIDVGDMPPREAEDYVRKAMEAYKAGTSADRESVRVLLEAAALQRSKAQDYQNPNSLVVQADYYPNGISTIQDIIWAKNLRARSLLESGEAPKHESLEDTYIDMINYASFAVAYLRGKVPGQNPCRDAFNRPKAAAASPVVGPVFDWKSDWVVSGAANNAMVFGGVTMPNSAISIAYSSIDSATVTAAAVMTDAATVETEAK